MIDKISIALIDAQKKHPHFADSLADAYVVLGEEVGEVAEAIYEHTRNGAPIEDLELEVAQVGAVSLRFLRFIEQYKKEQ